MKYLSGVFFIMGYVFALTASFGAYWDATFEKVCGLAAATVLNFLAGAFIQSYLTSRKS